MKVEREGESVVCPLLIFLKMELPAEPEGGWDDVTLRLEHGS